jgi:hypothetical protein
MSINHDPPRQHRPNVGRAPVKRHVGMKSVCTDKQPNDFLNPAAPKSAATQAGLYYSRAANRAGRPPLA